ncbi:MAG: hypothetical protein K2X49_13775 [Acetobacteraceae bacterium]|nr:hypothetical protein [Acetobacteraceae bacterium]
MAVLLALGSCAPTAGLGPTRHEAAMLELPAVPEAMAACLAAAYRVDGFGILLRTSSAQAPIVIEIHGMPVSVRRAPWRRVPRMTIEVQPKDDAATRVTLRTAWTLLGPDRDARTFLDRVKACAA